MPRAIDLGLERLWRERFRAFQRSGLSVREFCRGEAIREHVFFYWQRELAKRDRLRHAASPVPRRSRSRANRRRRRVNTESSSRTQPSRQAAAFVPMQVISEPLPTSCFEVRLGACLLRLPITIDEQTLRQAIRVVREEITRC